MEPRVPARAGRRVAVRPRAIVDAGRAAAARRLRIDPRGIPRSARRVRRVEGALGRSRRDANRRDRVGQRRALLLLQRSRREPARDRGTRSLDRVLTPFHGSRDPVPRSGGCDRGSLPRPVSVEGSLYLHEPDDRRDEQDPAREEPEAGPTGHRPLLPVLRVHLPDLRRDYEGLHRVEEDPDDEAEYPAKTLARVLLHLLLALEDPVPGVEVERDDEHENPEADPARPAERACVARRAHSLPPTSVKATEPSIGLGVNRVGCANAVFPATKPFSTVRPKLRTPRSASTCERRLCCPLVPSWRPDKR